MIPAEEHNDLDRRHEDIGEIYAYRAVTQEALDSSDPLAAMVKAIECRIGDMETYLDIRRDMN